MHEGIVKLNTHKDEHLVALVGGEADFSKHFYDVASYRLDTHVALLTFLSNYKPHLLIIGKGLYEVRASSQWMDTCAIIESVYSFFETRRKFLKKRSITIPTIKLGNNLGFTNYEERLVLYSKHEKLKQNYQKLVEVRCLKCKLSLDKAFRKNLASPDQEIYFNKNTFGGNS